MIGPPVDASHANNTRRQGAPRLVAGPRKSAYHHKLMKRPPKKGNVRPTAGGRWRTLVSVLTPVLLAATTLAAPALGAAAQRRAKEVPYAPPPVAAPVSPTPTPDPEETAYLIGPKDILKVTVYGHEDLSQQVLVQVDGTFMFPLIGRVSAGDMTINELERKLATLLARGFIRNPQVTVEVQEYRSKIVYVVGEVQKPGTYPLAGATGLVEILAKAGPMTQAAAAEVLVVRPPAGSETAGPTLPALEEAAESKPSAGEKEPKPRAADWSAEDKKDAEETDAEEADDESSAAKAPPGALVIRVNIRDLQAGALGKNVLLRPNDTVFVPQAPKVFVSGEVRNPGAYAFFPGITARQLISLAGGVTQYGSDGRLRVVRDTGGKSEEDKIRLDDPVNPGDTLVVRRKLF